MNLRSILSSFSSADRRRRTAVIFRQSEYTYEDLLGQVASVSANIQRTDEDLRILVQVKNPLTHIIACLAADEAANWVGQLHAGTELQLLRQLAGEFKPDILITDLESIATSNEVASIIPTILFLPEIRPDAPSRNFALNTAQSQRKGRQSSTVLFTSGSTGLPKGVVLPEANLPRNAELICDVLALSAQDVGAIFGPLSMGMNQIYVLGHLICGATIVLEENFLSPNDVVAGFAEYGITGLSTIPAAIDILLTRCDPRVLNTLPLRYMRIGAGRFTAEKIRTLQRRFPGVRVFKTYGLTEIGLVSVMDSDDTAAAYDSVGKPVEGVVVEIVNEADAPLPAYTTGEVVVSGAHQMREYFHDKDETSAVLKGGRIHTGDLGHVDSDGYLFITDRLKDMLKIAGESIHPAMIEKVVGRIKGVLEAVVISIEDPITGEAAQVFVEADDTANISPVEILKHCRSELPSRLVPKSVVIVDKLPRTVSGKVNRMKLRAPPNIDSH